MKSKTAEHVLRGLAQEYTWEHFVAAVSRIYRRATAISGSSVELEKWYIPSSLRMEDAKITVLHDLCVALMWLDNAELVQGGGKYVVASGPMSAVECADMAAKWCKSAITPVNGSVRHLTAKSQWIEADFGDLVKFATEIGLPIRQTEWGKPAADYRGGMVSISKEG